MHASPASCSRFATPDSSCEGYLDHFDWSILNSLPPSSEVPRRRPVPAIQLACSTKLRVLDKASDKTDGLAQLLHGTRSIIAQKWKTLTVYLSYDKDYPDCERLWSKKEWRKWDVVELLTGLCWKYHQELLKAKKDGAVLCTQTVDQEYLALVVQILELGVGEAKAIAIKDWERPGTKTTLESRSLLTEDVVVRTKKRKRKKKALRATERLRLFSSV